ncbi:MAG: DNA transformation protein [Gammaproteobacteria bacterium]
MSEFVEYLKEMFQGLGQIHSRKMFGGYGVFLDGIMFGLVAEDTLYLKVDDTTVEDYKIRGLTPFEYTKGDKIIKMSYYLAPEEVLENPDDATHWGKQAFEVAMRTKQK